LKKKGIEFYIEIDDDMPDVIILDEIRLRQILLNVIGNAVKFTEKGYVKLKLSMQYKNEDKSKLDLLFSIEDTGIGIPDSQKDNIFEAFEQQDGQSTLKFGGTGLGLAITKRFIEMMKGEIKISGELGKGSTFHIRLYDIKVSSISELEIERNSLFDEKSVKFKRKSILIVDDVSANRFLVNRYLEDYDFTLYEAGNGQEAIDCARNHKPDLVLMDMKMPIMDGLTATNFFKNDSDLNDIPIVALTASVMKEREKDIRKICDGYLRKPVSRNELIQELTKFLDHTIEENKLDKIIGTLAEETTEKFDQKLTTEILVEFPKFLKTLKNDFEPLWNDLKNSYSVDEIEEFAIKITDIGNEYKYDKIVHWGNLLIKHALMFDIDAASLTLSEFPEILNEIESKV